MRRRSPRTPLSARTGGLVNFRGDSAFSTWLYQIATNLARNRYWYWWRRKRDKSISFDAPLGADNEMTLADVIPAEVETPDDITVTQEFVSNIAMAWKGSAASTARFWSCAREKSFL